MEELVNMDKIIRPAYRSIMPEKAYVPVRRAIKNEQRKINLLLLMIFLDHLIYKRICPDQHRVITVA